MSKTGNLPHKAEYEILDSLEKDKIIEKIGRTNCKQIPRTYYDPVEHILDLVEVCRQQSKIQRWHGSDAEGAFLGVPTKLKIPKWKKEILELLMFRMKELFHAVYVLHMFEQKQPSFTDPYLRQVVLELIPYHLELSSKGSEGDEPSDSES